MSLLRSLCPAAACLLLIAATPARLSGQVQFTPQGAEYALAGHRPGDQVWPALALSTNGGFLVWQDNVTDGSGWGISAQAVDSSLSGTLFSSFRVNEQGAGDQERPQVTLLNNGGAAFVWQGGAAGAQHIYARFFSPSNTWQAGDVQVNTFPGSFQINPAIAGLKNGNVVVAWSSYDQAGAGSLQDVYAQVLSATGQKVGGEVLVNQFTAFNQRTPSVAALADGRFAVVWVSEQQRRSESYNPGLVENPAAPGAVSVDVYARLVSAGGAPAGNEFLVNTSTNICASPRVAAAGDGTFLVVWAEKDLATPSNGWDLWARPFSNTGTGGAVRCVNTQRYGDQFLPSLAAAATGYFVVWTSLGQDGSREGVYGQMLQNNASPVGGEIRVNSTTLSQQMQPAVASDGRGRFLAAWASFTGGANSFDVFTQRFIDTTQPVDPMGAPFVNAPFLVVGGNYQPQLTVSWSDLSLAGYDVASYDLYLDGATKPTLSFTANVWTMTAADGLTASSTHSFQIGYVLNDGRRSPLSPPASGTTWSGQYWGDPSSGVAPWEWMRTNYGVATTQWPALSDDTDHDGMTTLQELIAGTDPNDPKSVLRTDLRRTDQGVFLDWNTHPGFIYRVQTATKLAPSVWTDFGPPRLAAGTSDTLFVGGTAPAYYRILLVR